MIRKQKNVTYNKIPKIPCHAHASTGLDPPRLKRLLNGISTIHVRPFLTLLTTYRLRLVSNVILNPCLLLNLSKARLIAFHFELVVVDTTTRAAHLDVSHRRVTCLTTVIHIPVPGNVIRLVLVLEKRDTVLISSKSYDTNTTDVRINGVGIGANGKPD